MWELDARERRWRAELDRQARSTRRRLEDVAARLRPDHLDQRPLDLGSSEPSRRDGRAEAPSLEDQVLIWAVPVATAASLPLIVGHLAALLVNGGWPRYRWEDAPGILARVVSNPGDPGRAWEPVNTGAAVPGAAAWWGTLVVVALFAGLAGLLVWSARQTSPSRARSSGGPRWARRSEQRAMWVRKGEPHRLVLGAADGHRLAVRDRHSVLVAGPAHTGKTSSVSIPAVLEWRGPAVVVSTKGHLIDQTIGWRSHQGDVHVYDPAQVTRYHPSGWSLLADCRSWEGAIRTASDLTLAARATVGASRAGDGITSEDRGEIWRSSMAMSLAPFLFAAVASGRSIGAAAEWIEREERDEVLEVLDGVNQTAARAHRTSFLRADPSRSKFLHAMHEILSVYEDPVVAASMERHEILPEELLDGGDHTLYITTPEHDQARFRPLCAMIVRRVLVNAFAASARAGRPLDPPLLLVLDDVLGIAPIYDLAALASTAAPRGVQIVSVVQDLAQLDEQYGEAADLVVKNHPARLMLSGGSAPLGRGSEQMVPAALTNELGADEAALVYASHHPTRLQLRPWFRDRELRRRVETPQDLLPPVDHDDNRVHVPVAEQSAAWMRRVVSGDIGDPVDPTIPLDTSDPAYIEVFGSLDEEPQRNVTSIFARSRHRGGSDRH
jgi:type IV secretion system protein VirD4